MRIIKTAALRGTIPGEPRRDDMRADFWMLYDQVAPYTMTSPERRCALRDVVHHIARAKVPGDIVECGVWRGGSAMMAALAMQEAGDKRKLWLYDTFEGMTKPGEHDRDYTGAHVITEYQRRISEEGSWAKASLEDVRANLSRTSHDEQAVSYVRGRVEDTIPQTVPNQIALLRLDTDWYESTRHELEHLWPRLSSGGVLIIDDYGHFEGARKAVDEYFASQELPILLHRIDYTGRAAIKYS